MTQYLNEHNHYQKQLIKMAQRGERFVVTCTEESQEPHYEGFRTFDVARGRANQLQADFGFAHAVYELTTETDDSVTCNYEDVRG